MKTATLFMTTAAVTTLAALPLSSFAQTRTMNDSGPYIGAGAAWNTIDEGPLDDDTAGFKLYAGWQFNPILGAEASYVNFDEFESEGASLDTDGFGIAATAGFPVAPMFTPYVKVGQFWWDSEANVADVDLDADDNDTFYGVGAKFPVNDAFAVRLEAERYDVAGADIDSVSVNGQMNF